MERKIELRQFASVLTMFLITQFGGLLIIAYFLPPSQVSIVIPPPATVTTTTSGIPLLLILPVEFIVVVAVFVFVLRYATVDLIFKGIGVFGIVLPMMFLFSFIIPMLFPQYNYNTVTNSVLLLVGSIFLGLLFYLLIRKVPHTKNIVVTLSAMGIGVIGLSFSLTLAYVFFAIFAVYDYIAVFVTKHMIAMANMAVKYNLPLMIDASNIEILPPTDANKKDLKEVREQIKAGKLKDPMFKDIVASGNLPIVSQIGLGNGDLGLPLLLVISAYITLSTTQWVFFVPIALIVGSLAGLMLTFYILKKYNVALPALPPIFGMINIMLGIVTLIVPITYSGIPVPLPLLFFAIGLVSSFVVYNKARSLHAQALMKHPGVAQTPFGSTYKR